MQLPESAVKLLTSGRLAHLVTLNPDGSPQMSCVWVDVRDGEIVMAHLGEGQKMKNVQRDPRVSLSMEAGTKNAMGLTEFLVVHGRAHVTPGGAPELLQDLARRYMGPDVEFPTGEARQRPGRIMHIQPTRISGVGPWTSAE